MARLVIDVHSDVPSYLQLAELLRERIRAGEIEPRGPMPSISYIQQETGLAVNTIRHAIRILADEGWAYTVPGRGTFATDKPPE